MGSGTYFNSQIESRNGVARIALSGELDLATAPVLNEQLAHLEVPGIESIMLDLRDLTFMDGEGLRTFISADERAKANGHRLILIGAGPSARRLFELTDTQYLLDEQEAGSILDRFTATDERMADALVADGESVA